MGRRGPPKIPTEILKARGSPIADHRTDEPQSGRGVPRMPQGMCAQARTIWRRVAPALDEMGVLTTNDGDILGRYCVLLSRWQRLTKVLEKEGDTYRTTGDAGQSIIKVHPAVSIVRSLGIELLKIEDRFGLHPSARASLSVNAIFQSAKRQQAKDGDAAHPNVIHGKDRFFGGKPA